MAHRILRADRLLAGVIGVLAIALPVFAPAETHVVVLRGLGGEARLEARFQDWSTRLEQVLVDRCGVPEARIQVAPAPQDSDATHALTRVEAERILTEAASVVQREDTLILVLIGHGSLQREAKFMVEGPDIAASDFGLWLDAIPAVEQVVINTASSSAAFINALSAPGRIICTSTRNGTERNAPEFMEHFLRTLEAGRGDANRNGEVTLAELCNAAAIGTQAWFESEGYIATEHALLDDNGDGRGTRLPLDEESEQADGVFAKSFVVQPDAALAGADPALLAAYRAAIASVKSLTAEKDTLEREDYWNRLEALLLEAARLNRAIQAGAPSSAE